MSLRMEFVQLASAEGANVRALCRAFAISPTTGYTWLTRYRHAGSAGLVGRSSRPHTTPGQTDPAITARVLAVREAHPSWGGRKIQRRLQDLGEPAPAASTITAILQRHGRIDPAASATHRPYQRFVATAPNELWQLDFTGHFALAQGRCHPLPVVDDHSRFLLGLQACPDQTGPTVQAHLTALFRQYGMPARVLCDNGAPWGTAADHDLTTLSVWLLRLGVGVVHGRPRHPQTQGKVERLHRTLGAEVLLGGPYLDLPTLQTAFDAWRDIYNHERPHAALGLDTPARHYRSSGRPFPETIPELSYDPHDQIRKVDQNGLISFQGQPWRISAALAGLPVGIRPASVDGCFEVRFGVQIVRTLDRRVVPPSSD